MYMICPRDANSNNKTFYKMFLGSGEGDSGGQSLKCFNHPVLASVLLQTQSKGNASTTVSRRAYCCTLNTGGVRKGMFFHLRRIIPAAVAAAAAAAAAAAMPLLPLPPQHLHPSLQQATQNSTNICATPHGTMCAPRAFERLPHVRYSPRSIMSPRCLAMPVPPRALGLLQLLHLAFQNFDPGEGYLELACQCDGTVRRGGAA